MNALHKAQSAYRDHAQPTRSNRSIEYDAFARITHRLKSSATGGHRNTHALISALHDNRRLWTTLAADLAGDGNALPGDLRARILSLAEFTRTYSSKVMNGAPAEPLIDINTAMMRGLRDGRANR